MSDIDRLRAIHGSNVDKINDKTYLIKGSSNILLYNNRKIDIGKFAVRHIINNIVVIYSGNIEKTMSLINGNCYNNYTQGMHIENYMVMQTGYNTITIIDTITTDVIAEWKSENTIFCIYSIELKRRHLFIQYVDHIVGKRLNIDLDTKEIREDTNGNRY